MSLMPSKPRIETTAPAPSAAQPFRQTQPAPAFRPEVMRSLRMHPVVAWTVGLVVFLGLLAVASTMKPIYLAESRVYVEPTGSSPLNDPNGGGFFDAGKYDSYLQQQMQTATRLDILERAVRSLPESTWSDFGRTPEMAALYLRNALKVDRVTTSYQLSIGLKGSDAEKTAAMVNAVTTAYLDAGKRDEVARTDSRRQILEEERQRIVAELAADRAEQAELSKSIGVASAAAPAGNPYDTQLATLRGELIAARQAHEAAAAQLSSVTAPDPTAVLGLDAQATDAIAADSGLATLKSSLGQRRATLLTQMQGLKPENPIYRQDQQELAELDRAIDLRATQLRDQAARRLQDKLRTDLARTGDLEARLNADVARETAAATSAAPKLQRAEELTFSIARLTARFATVDDALRTIALETNGLPMAHLSLAAAVPTQPEASRRRLVMVAALPLAILLACFAAATMHRRDPRIYIARDMEDVLGFAPIAVLPAREDVSDRVVEEYVLRLAGGVEGAYRNDGARTFVLTPVSAATSIQSLVTSLARKLEDLGLDVVRTRAGEMLLDAGASYASGVGRDSTRSRALAAEGARVSLAATALDQLKTMHDLIFIDAPALLTSAEAEYVARCADATILVAECGVTLKHELYQSAALLERLQVTGVGTVLEELRLRYADSAFRDAVMLVEKRTQAARNPRTATFGRTRVASSPGGAAAVSDPFEYPTPEPSVDFESTTVAPGNALAQEKDPARPVTEPLPEYFGARGAADNAQGAPESEVRAPAYEVSAGHEPAQTDWREPEAAFAANELTHQSGLEPGATASASAPEDHVGEYPREVWPARPARSERPLATKLAEQEMLSASGTAVFLKPRRIAIERLEPLGEQAALSYSADMLANSFGPLPIDIEPERSYQVLPRGVSVADAEAEIRAANERNAAEIRRRWQANGGATQDPLATNEIRRLLNPSAAPNAAPAGAGKDMIGARADSIPARGNRLTGRRLEGDAGMSEKKGWFQKLFQRETPGTLKIAPEADLAEDEQPLPHNALNPAPKAARAWTPGPPPVQPLRTAPVPSFRPVASVMAPSLPVDDVRPAAVPAPSRMPPDITELLQATAPRGSRYVESVTPPPQVPVASEQAALAAAAAIVAESEKQVPVRTAAIASPFLNPIVPPRRPKSFTELSQERRQGMNGLAAEPPSVRPSLQSDVPLPAEPVPVAVVATIAGGVETNPRVPDVPAPVAAIVEPTPVAAVEVAAPQNGEPQPVATTAAGTSEPTFPAITTPIWETAPQVRSSGTRWPERPAAVADSQDSPKESDSSQRWAVRPKEEALPHWPPRAESDAAPASDSGSRIPTNLLDVQGPALTRRWGLLSRYQATEEVESDRS